MRKSAFHKQASIQLENHHPGCMWGALHMLDYLAWRRVKKMLPYKRRPGQENNSYTIQGQVAGQEDRNNERMVERQSTKGSVRSRLKSHILEDILRRKAKHHRSSTYPTQSKSDVLNVEEGKDSNHLREQRVSDPLSPKASSALPPFVSNDEAKVHSTAQWVTFSDTSGESDNQKELVSSHTIIQETLQNAKQALLDQKLMSAKEQSNEAPLYQSKEFLDALDLVNLDKEVLQGILQEQGSSHCFQNQHSFKMTTGSGSTSPKKSKQNPEGSSMDGEETVGSPSLRNKEKSQVAIRHFKILTSKLRHAIKESKKEKHRITMDGVLHRIPYGHKLSADVKEITNYWKERVAHKDKKDAFTRSCGSSPIHQKVKINHFRRTSSTGDSMDKYCWLYESSFKKKQDPPSLESCKEIKKEEQTKKSLGRILSLPDLKSYYYIPNEYLNDTYASRSPIRTVVDSKSVLNRNLSFAFEPVNERKLPSAVNSPGADDLIEPLTYSMAIEQLKSKEHVEADGISNFSTNLTATTICDQGPDLDGDFEFSFSQASANAVDIFASDQDLLPTQLQDEAENHLGEPDYKYLQVDSRDEVEFTYVKNVLDLAGLSRNHPHESFWHASDQLVDPGVFEEVQGLEGYNNLILFDMINEVLMDMYEKSFSYCPLPLSSLCRLRSMPTGDRVLSEVWSNISCYFSSRSVHDDTLDYVIHRDLVKSKGWMNLQFDTECVGLELEDMIFDDLLDELIFNYLLQIECVHKRF